MEIKIVNGIKTIKDKYLVVKENQSDNIKTQKEYDSLLSSYKTSEASFEVKKAAIENLERKYPNFSKSDFSVENQIRKDISQQYEEN